MVPAKHLRATEHNSSLRQKMNRNKRTEETDPRKLEKKKNVIPRQYGEHETARTVEDKREI